MRASCQGQRTDGVLYYVDGASALTDGFGSAAESSLRICLQPPSAVRWNTLM